MKYYWARPKVVPAVRQRVRVETGELSDFAGLDRVALAVHWSDEPPVSRSFRTLVSELSTGGYQVIVISASEFAEPLEWSGDLPTGTLVLRKPNLGYDFGSWAVGLDLFPAIATTPNVLLVNDSLLGPFSSLASILAAFESSAAEVWGLTDTTQYFHHLQSYFMGFHNGVLAERPLRRFWSGIRDEPTKWDVIRNGELALSRLFAGEGYVTEVAYRADSVVGHGENPVIRAWWALLEAGFPFVKREIVRDPSVAPRGEWVAKEIEAVFDARLDEWI